ncbi:zinc-dependent metalloprotease [Rosistilla oblonga]|uniref:DUF5117 domain-containing protein n=1 Tax=Rosistilla oblonga TaxID=2527990 RepID=A0A518IPY1_9BACT|nr:zinc-dependent metalloprotease [Rosistilla oblonga]QDV55132.1 hypothetical protein Mal33_11010 [Rosistilla oblonga]
MKFRNLQFALRRSASLALLLLVPGAAFADLPAFDKVSEGYKKLTSSDQQSDKTLFNIWTREKDGQMLAELPKAFAGKRYFIALTVGSGDRYAGLQSGDMVVQWRQYDERLALVLPNLEVTAKGEAEASASVKRLFTDRVLLDVPILAKGPSGGPVIDMDNLLISNASSFFGNQVRITKSRIYKIEQAKVFPENVELAYEIVGSRGQLQTIHYSFSEVPATSNGFKPRKADERVGYFTTAFTDLSKYTDDETRVRYINRWHLEKRDPKLQLSPPKNPIRFYVEHTAPVRYRRWIKQGVDYWNKAFEKVGIVDAIVIEYQDAPSGAHMEKDPEDVRYNFIRWLNNNIGTAIGPSRVHPETGQILDADIILTDGWIRHFNFNYYELMPELAMEGMSPETLAWLADNPSWDPRVRLAHPAQRLTVRESVARSSRSPMAGHSFAAANPQLMGDDEYDGLYGNISQKNGLCMAANGRRMDLALTRMNWTLALLEEEKADAQKKKKEEEEKAAAEKKKAEAAKAKKDDSKDEDKKSDEAKDDKKDDAKDEEAVAKKDDKKEEKKDDDKPKDQLLDGIPEWFVGPLLADLVAHEVGHTLGLRHNFKASSVHSLDEINSEAIKGKKTFTGSVMDYTPINFRLESGDVQGDYAMIEIGPYDYWAVEYGYTFTDADLPKILKRCHEPELQYATDEDTSGPDPLARRYDFGRDPLDYAKEQMKLVQLYRSRILDKFVKDGDSWAKARRGYELTLSKQTSAVSMMAGWVGGAFVHRDKKGDPEDRSPIEVVPAEQQRAALNFVIETSFNDDSYGLTPDLLARMSVDKWLDEGFSRAMTNEATWPIHDRILGLQASALTMIMNPTTLRRVYDNEFRLPADQDTVTLPELLGTIRTAVWTELGEKCPADCSSRNPMISSLRRNLQREHLDRLIDLMLKKTDTSAAAKPISNLAMMQTKELKDEIDKSLGKCGDDMDAYTKAHLSECQSRIEQALNAGYVFNSGNQQQGPLMFILSGDEPSAE